MPAARKTAQPRQPVHTAIDFGSHERRILLLQGGGALGAYQAGVYEGSPRPGSRPTGSSASRSARSTPR